SLKLVVVRARPGAGPWATGGASFPSGHVANAALAVAATLGMARAVRPRSDKSVWILGIAGVMFVTATAWSRIYLGRHWLTDVVASLLMTLAFWNAASPRADAPPCWRRLVLAGVCVAVLVVAAALGRRFRLDSPETLGGDSRVKSALPVHESRSRPAGQQVRS